MKWLSLLLFTAASSVASGQPTVEKPIEAAKKNVAEPKPKKAKQGAAKPKKKVDFTKRVVELPRKVLLAAATDKLKQLQQANRPAKPSRSNSAELAATLQTGGAKTQSASANSTANSTNKNDEAKSKQKKKIDYTKGRVEARRKVLLALASDKAQQLPKPNKAAQAKQPASKQPTPKQQEQSESNAGLATRTVRQDVMKVKPGLVNWHADYVTAIAAAKKSGKPVLLFQLLGQLDEHFT